MAQTLAIGSLGAEPRRLLSFLFADASSGKEESLRKEGPRKWRYFGPTSVSCPRPGVAMTAPANSKVALAHVIELPNCCLAKFDRASRAYFPRSLSVGNALALCRPAFRESASSLHAQAWGRVSSGRHRPERSRVTPVRSTASAAGSSRKLRQPRCRSRCFPTRQGEVLYRCRWTVVPIHLRFP